MRILIIFLTVSIASALAGKNGKIAGGSDAVRGQFPWHVKLEVFDGSTVTICGGALIRYNFVLTTAVCIKDAVDIILRFGMIDRLEGPISAIFRITSSDHIIIHPDYNPINFANDLALLYLEGAETLLEADYVEVIDLPKKEDAEYELIGLRGNVTGFGLTNDDIPAILPVILQWVELPIISNEECIQAHGSTIIYEDKFCLDGRYGSTCILDEGAPFATLVDGRRVLGGIGTIALTQCTAGWPSIYTSLFPHLDWIEDNTRDPPGTDTTTTAHPPGPPGDRCNCVCKCFVCHCEGEPIEPTSFKKRWIEKK